MDELINKWDVVSKLISLENEYQFFKGSDFALSSEKMYHRICELEITIGKTHGVTVQEWIPVKERLPEELPENKGKKVIPCLVSLKSLYPNGKPNTQKRQRQLQYYGNGCWKWEWSRIGADRVTHWMPLPEPPKEE